MGSVFVCKDSTIIVRDRNNLSASKHMYNGTKNSGDTMKKILAILVLVVGLASAADKPTLYTRLGGYDAIAALLTDFHVRLKDDPQLVASGNTAAPTAKSANCSC